MKKEELFMIRKQMGQAGFGKLKKGNLTEIVDYFKTLCPNDILKDYENLSQSEILDTLGNYITEDNLNKICSKFNVDKEEIKSRLNSLYVAYLFI